MNDRAAAFDERRRAAIPACVVALHDICVVEGRGVRVTDSEDRTYVDLTGGLGVMLLGYAHPDVDAAAFAQWRRIAHTSFPTMASQPYVALAEALAGLVGTDTTPYKSFFVNSGAEAVDNAMKVASWVTGRGRFLGLEAAFHGRTIGALALTAREKPFKQGLRFPLADVSRIPIELAVDVAQRRVHIPEIVAALEAIARANGGAESFAALVVEPVLGEGGIVVLPDAFLVAAEIFCKRHGILHVADEIQCGLGRTGVWFRSIAAGTQPDMVIAGKPLGGGLPLAAIVGKAAILDRLHVGALGTTQGGNPVACAAGLALLDVLRRDRLLDRAVALGEAIEKSLAHLHGKMQRSVRLSLRVKGAMAAVAFECAEAPERGGQLVAAVLKEARAQGVLLLRGGRAGETVRMLPPLVIDDATLASALATTAAVVESVVASQA